MTRKFNLFLLVMAVLLGAPYYWLLLDNSHAAVPAKRIDIAELRRLAASLPGPAPDAIHMEYSAYRRLPGNFLVAGSGLKRKHVAYMSFELTVPGGRPIVIESGIPASVAESSGAERFHAATQQRIYQAMDQAGIILVTHEHSDHLGALAEHGGRALSEVAWLNPRQLPPAAMAARLAWPKGPLPPARLNGRTVQAVAPGVVVIPAPDSHSPGSQLIYVRLASGREYLFVGDISSFAQNWQEMRGRSRLVETWYSPDNRTEVFAWLQGLQALKRQVPGLVIVPGHDGEWIRDAHNHTGIAMGFPT